MSKIEGIPAGWEFLKVGAVVIGDEYVDKFGKVETADFESVSKNYVIVRPIFPVPPKYIPWTFETCPVGAVLKLKRGKFRGELSAAGADGAWIGSGYYRYGVLLEDFQLDGTPCGTIEEAK